MSQHSLTKEQIKGIIESFISDHELQYSVDQVIQTLTRLSLYPPNIETLLQDEGTQENRADNFDYKLLKNKAWLKFASTFFNDYVKVNKNVSPNVKKEDLLGFLIYLNSLEESGIWPLNYAKVLENNEELILDSLDEEGYNVDEVDEFWNDIGPYEEPQSSTIDRYLPKNYAIGSGLRSRNDDDDNGYSEDYRKYIKETS